MRPLRISARKELIQHVADYLAAILRNPKLMRRVDSPPVCMPQFLAQLLLSHLFQRIVLIHLVSLPIVLNHSRFDCLGSTQAFPFGYNLSGPPICVGAKRQHS